MRHFSFDQLEFQNLIPVKIEVIGGSRPRLTLEHKKTKQKFFLKSYRHNTREIWAEMLASHLGEIINIPIQNVSLKKIPGYLAKIFRNKFKSYLPVSWRPIGALVRNIFPKKHEAIYGAQIIGTASDPVSLQTVEDAIRRNYLDSEDLLQNFSDMVVFDAWIGNMDRHHENWGIIQKNMPKQLRFIELTQEDRLNLKASRWFSKLFDHGSSLLFELDEEKVTHYLHDTKKLDQYILGKKYALLLGINDEPLNVFQILENHVKQKTKWGPRIRKSIQKVLKADSLNIARLIIQMPTDGILDYSYSRKRLVYCSLERRKSLLSDVLGYSYGN